MRAKSSNCKISAVICSRQPVGRTQSVELRPITVFFLKTPYTPSDAHQLHISEGKAGRIRMYAAPLPLRNRAILLQRAKVCLRTTCNLFNEGFV